MIASRPYSIRVMDVFDVLDPEGVSVRPSSRKVCALLAILALSRGHRQTRGWLQSTLWGTTGPAQAAASLRQALTTLRHVFSASGDAVGADRTWVWLDPYRVRLETAAPAASGGLLRDLELREEGFAEWLREVRAGVAAVPTTESAAAPGDRAWYIETPPEASPEDRIAGISDLICDSIVEVLSVIGITSVIDRRIDVAAPVPRATDMIVRVRSVRVGAGCMLSVAVTDGFGSLKCQVRREVELTRWPDVRAAHVEIAQLVQDFAIRFEADVPRGASWGAYANGCQALMGVLVPGSMPLRDIERYSQAAIAANDKGVYHALLGFSRLLLYGERESRTAPDAEAVMQTFRTAMRLAPGNGLVQALAGHAYGFLLHDLERNAAMTREAVRLLPGSGPCWLFRAISLVYSARYDRAVEAATTAVWLCKGTVAQPMALSTELYARLMAGDTRGAIRCGEMSLDSIVFRPTIADLMIAYAVEGRVEAGRAKLALLVRREPDLSLDMLKSPSYPIVNGAHRTRLVEAATRLGLR
jgi:hypothetical protein